jgi:hypothetical protein
MDGTGPMPDEHVPKGDRTEDEEHHIFNRRDGQLKPGCGLDADGGNGGHDQAEECCGEHVSNRARCVEPHQ